MIRIGMVVTPQAFLASVGAMVDSFGLTRDRLDHIVSEPDKAKSRLEFTVLSIDGKPVEVGAGLIHPVDRAISPDDRFDVIWLPSFRFDGAQRLKDRLASLRPLDGWLRDRHAEGSILCASSSAIMLLVQARLLDGLGVPVSRLLLPTVRELFPRCRADDKLRIVEHPGMILGSGLGNDLGVIARAMSRSISAYSGRWLAAAAALESTEAGHLSADPLVASAQIWIEQFYASDLTIADLAARLSTSHQTLTRRFHAETGMTPKAYAQQLRLAAAKGMLRNTRLSIDAIARFAGFSDVRVFRERFRKSTGMAASAWRREHRRHDENHPEIAH